MPSQSEWCVTLRVAVYKKGKANRGEKRTVEPGKSEPREKANRRTAECRISNVEGSYSVTQSLMTHRS